MTSKDFIKIGVDRIRINTIKHYKPLGDLVIVIRYSSDPNNKKAETYRFDDKETRDETIELLDLLCFK